MIFALSHKINILKLDGEFEDLSLLGCQDSPRQRGTLRTEACWTLDLCFMVQVKCTNKGSRSQPSFMSVDMLPSNESREETSRFDSIEASLRDGAFSSSTLGFSSSSFISPACSPLQSDERETKLESDNKRNKRFLTNTSVRPYTWKILNWSGTCDQ